MRYFQMFTVKSANTKVLLTTSIGLESKSSDKCMAQRIKPLIKMTVHQ